MLGIIQGFTEFLPISSSGHIELGKALLGVSGEGSFIFTVVVHGATVLSTIVVFYKDILQLTKDFFRFEWNSSTKYVMMILLSMIPACFVGLLFKNEIESMFTGNVLLVGSMLLVTSLVLFITYYAPKKENPISFKDAIIIGIVQAIAITPGISRSGSTIATGIMLGIKKEDVAKFSFLMVLLPIIGANLKDFMDGGITDSTIGIGPLAVGFIAAFISGIFACRWMIDLVKKSKLTGFALYCLVVGLVAISVDLFL